MSQSSSSVIRLSNQSITRFGRYPTIVFGVGVLLVFVVAGPARANELLATGFTSGGVEAVDGTTGQYLGQFAPARGAGGQTSGIAVTSDGTVFVAAYGQAPNDRISEYAPDGTYLGSLPSAYRGEVVQGIAVGWDGNLQVLETRGTIGSAPSYIDTYDPSSGTLLYSTLVGSSSQVVYPGFAAAPNGNMVYNMLGELNILNSQGWLIGQQYLATDTDAIAIDSQGDVFYGGTGDEATGIFECQYCASNTLFSFGETFQFAQASTGIGALTFGPDGNLYASMGGVGGGNIIEEFNGITGADMGTFATLSPGFKPFELTFDSSATFVAPEPGTLVMLASGLMLCAAGVWKRRRVDQR